MSHMRENSRLRFRKANADAMCPLVAVADSRTASTAGAIVVLVLYLCLASPAASSQSCGPAEVVSDLFRHSQIAERSEDREGRSNEFCSTGVTTLVEAVGDDLDPLDVPASDNSLRSQLLEAIGSRVLVDRPSNPENTNTLYVGCEEEILNLFDVAVAVEMRFYRWDADIVRPDVIQLDVVYRQGDGDGDSEWHSVIVADPDFRDIVVLPGTHTDVVGELRQWLANFAGENCTFRAARFAVHAMCEHANLEEGDDSDSSLRMENGMPVVVGHSLGGAAAQYIATSRSSQESSGWPGCPGVNAYAFGSIGLTPSSVGAIRGTLKTYASDCDWLVSNRQFPFSDSVQTGHLFTLWSDSHSIDGIQDDLCGCLRGDENHVFQIHDSSEPPQANGELCESRNRQG